MLCGGDADAVGLGVYAYADAVLCGGTGWVVLCTVATVAGRVAGTVVADEAGKAALCGVAVLPCGPGPFGQAGPSCG